MSALNPAGNLSIGMSCHKKQAVFKQLLGSTISVQQPQNWLFAKINLCILESSIRNNTAGTNMWHEAQRVTRDLFANVISVILHLN